MNKHLITKTLLPVTTVKPLLSGLLTSGHLGHALYLWPHKINFQLRVLFTGA